MSAHTSVRPPEAGQPIVPRPSASKDVFYLLAVVVAVVAIATLYFARIVLIPFALALLFTFILTPLVKILERAHFGRILSVLLVVLLSVGACGAVGWTVAKQFTQVVDQLPDYKANIRTKLTSLHWSNHHALDNASQTMTEIGKDLAATPAVLPSGDSTVTQSSPKRAAAQPRPIPVEVVKPPALPLESMQNVLGLLASVLIVLVFTIFMLIRREDLRNRLISLAGDGNLHLITQTLDDASARVSRYLLLQFVVNTCYGIFIGVGLHFIGLPGALLWGVIVGTLRFLPYVGPPLGGIMPLLLSLAVFDGWTRPLIVLGLFVFTEVIVSNFIEPFLYGIHTGISSLAILVAAIFWTAIWGPIGLVLSTPLTVCLLVVGRHVPRLRFLQILLGDEPPLTPDSRFYQRLLAMDHEEARQVLEKCLEGKTLEELYDSVLIPALNLAEQDRHGNRLDDANEKFICQSTRELIDEFWEPRSEESAAAVEGGQRRELSLAVALRADRSRKIVCVPARDEADEIVAIMLAQVLETAGHPAQYVPLGTTAEMLAQIKEEKPDVVCISALPPFAIPHARALYAKLRAQDSSLRIIVGLWNFSDDPSKVNRRLGLAEGSRAFSTLAELRQALEGVPDAVPVPSGDD